MDIFGNSKSSGFLKNPLDTDLQANNFNAYNFTEVHLDELHDNSGTGKIVVHEEFNMTNKRITNMADPVAAKDAVTLSYYENNMPAQINYYDVTGAVTDEQTPISVGIQAGSFNVPREFTCDKVVFYLRNGATAALYTATIYIDGNAVSWSQFPSFVNAGDLVSQDGYFQGGPQTILAGSSITVGANNDATASGLKVALIGTI